MTHFVGGFLHGTPACPAVLMRGRITIQVPLFQEETGHLWFYPECYWLRKWVRRDGLGLFYLAHWKLMQDREALNHFGHQVLG